jgi:hypothetical protein
MKYYLLLPSALLILSGCTVNVPELWQVRSSIDDNTKAIIKMAEQPPELRYTLPVCDRATKRMQYGNVSAESPQVILNVLRRNKSDGKLFIDEDVEKFLDRFQEVLDYCDLVTPLDND